jgi:dipeptidyl aminopeptidase/acylaminoacyl peptidase
MRPVRASALRLSLCIAVVALTAPRLLALSACAGEAGPAAAVSSVSGRIIPRALLFGDPHKEGAGISPDGKRLSWLAPANGVMNVWVAPVDRPDEAKLVTHEEVRPVREHYWAYDSQHILFLQDVGGKEHWRVYSADVDGAAVKDLTPFEGATARIADVSPKVRSEILITLNKRDLRFPDLYRLNIESGALTLVAENPGFKKIFADRFYKPKLAEKLTEDDGKQVFRLTEDGKWEPWIKFSAEDQLVSGPVQLRTGANTALFLDSRGRNTAALTEINLVSGEIKTIAGDPRADIGTVAGDLETDEPLAYSVTYERLEHKPVGPRLEGDLAFLAEQKIGDWRLMSRSENDRLWIVSAGSDVQPEAAYLYDRQAKTLTKLYDAQPELAGAPLAEMHPVEIKTRDGLELVSYLTVPKGADSKTAGRPDAPGPMALLVHGGPWGRDSFGFNAQHQWLANRGYSVLSVNFRSSSGLGKALINAGDLEWGRKMDDDLLDAVAWAVDQKIADPKRIAIMGGSYGGYATLVSMTRNPETYACGVDVVGPSELEMLLKTFPPKAETERRKFYKAMGDPDTEAGRALLKERSPLYRADRIKRPLLIGQGANDLLVVKAQSDLMAGAMKAKGIPVAYVVYPDEGHGFTRPQNRISFQAVAEQFLAECLGGRSEAISAAELKGSTLTVEDGAAQINGLEAALKARDSGTP